jgi:hypothetical protein
VVKQKQVKGSGDRAQFGTTGKFRNQDVTKMGNVNKLYIGKITGSSGWEVENEKH